MMKSAVQTGAKTESGGIEGWLGKLSVPGPQIRIGSKLTEDGGGCDRGDREDAEANIFG
jgi:hypothetical protein